jgi:hypothetical protein
LTLASAILAGSRFRTSRGYRPTRDTTKGPPVLLLHLRVDKLRGLLRVYGAQPLIGVLTGRWLPGPAACELRIAVRGLTPSGANDRSGFEETTMRVSTKGFLISAFILGVSANVYAQGAGGGGAAGGQGGTGMSKPNAGGSTDTVSGASGANTMAPAGTTSHKKMHKKSNAAMSASAPTPGSGGN